MFLPSIQVRAGFALQILTEDLFMFSLLVKGKTGKPTWWSPRQHWLSILQTHWAQCWFSVGLSSLTSLPAQAPVTLLWPQGPLEPKLGVTSGHKYFPGNSQCPGTCSSLGLTFLSFGASENASCPEGSPAHLFFHLNYHFQMFHAWGFRGNIKFAILSEREI